MALRTGTLGEYLARLELSNLLFGTDYPLRTFPKLQPAPCFQRHIDSLRAAGLSDTERTAILGQNLHNLIYPLHNSYLNRP